MDLMAIKSAKREAILKKLRKEYPKGTEVELISMNEKKMKKGLKGKVNSIDDIGTIHVSWENGSSLGLIYGEDEFKKI